MPSAIYFNDWESSFIPQILKEIYIDRIYVPFLTGKKNLTIVDVGANIGLTSYYFKDFGKVYAIEPSKQHLECLEAMIKQNEIKNIEVCPFAISDKKGKQTFYHTTNNTAYSLIKTVPDNMIKGSEEVETITLKELLSLKGIEKIDLLKLDVEGEESKIIVSPEFKELKIDMIIGEYHDWTSMGKKTFMNTFRDLGYEFQWLIGLDASVFRAFKLPEKPIKIRMPEGKL